MIKILMFFSLLVPLVAISQVRDVWNSPKISSGKDYEVLKKVEVTCNPNTVFEFFNPGCPACFNAEPKIEAWLKTKPAGIKFSRVPLAFHEEWKIYSEAYYLSVALHIENKVTSDLFDTIHVKQKMLSTPDEMAAFFVQATHGKYKAAQIKSSLSSPTMQADLERSQNLMNEYQISELPTIIVGCKYKTSIRMSGTTEKMFQIVNNLLHVPHKLTHN